MKFHDGAGRGPKYIRWRDTPRSDKHSICVCGVMQVTRASNPIRDAFVQWSLENRDKWTLLCADAFSEWYDCNEKPKNIITVNEQRIVKVVVLQEKVCHPGIGKVALMRLLGNCNSCLTKVVLFIRHIHAEGGRDPLHGNLCEKPFVCISEAMAEKSPPPKKNGGGGMAQKRYHRCNTQFQNGQKSQKRPSPCHNPARSRLCLHVSY